MYYLHSNYTNNMLVDNLATIQKQKNQWLILSFQYTWFENLNQSIQYNNHVMSLSCTYYQY